MMADKEPVQEPQQETENGVPEANSTEVSQETPQELTTGVVESEAEPEGDSGEETPEADEPGEYDDLFNGLYAEKKESKPVINISALRKMAQGKQSYNPFFLIPPPVIDPFRSDEEADEDAQLRDMESFLDMDFSASRLSTKVQAINEQTMIVQARFFLQFVLVPYIRSTANSLRRAPDAYLREYIQDDIPIRELLEIENFYHNPRVKMFQSLVKKYLPQDDAELRDPIMIDWWLDRLIDVDPQLGYVVRDEENGRKWLSDALLEITRYLRGKVL